MANLSVIYKIAADISGLESNVAKGVSVMENMQSAAIGLGSAFGIAFGVKEVIGFGKEVIDLAGKLQDLSARTGIGVEALQELAEIASESGSSIDTLASSINAMQKRLSGGDDAAVEALQALGLSLQDLMQMTPDKQFYEIAQAIAAIKDPAKQVELGMKIFGKSFGEIKATVLADMEEIKNGTAKMSGETSKALDDLWDHLTRFAGNVKVHAAETIAYIWSIPATEGERAKREAEEAAALIEQMHKMSGDVKSPFAAMLGASGGKPLPIPDAGWIKDFTRGIEVLVDQEQKAGAAAKKAADEHLRFADSVKRTTSDAVGAVRGFGMIGQLLPELTGDTQGWREELETLSSTDLPNLDTRLQHTGLAAGIYSKQIEDAAKVSRTFGSTLKQMFDPANIAKGFALGLGQQALNSLENLAMKGLKSLGKLFGIGDSERKVNPIRQMFIDAAGGLEVLSRKLLDATGSGELMQRILNAKNMKDYEAAVKDAGAAIKDFGKRMSEAFEAMQKAANGLKLKLADLREIGPELAAALETLFNARTPQEYAEAVERVTGAIEDQQKTAKILDETLEKYGLTWENLGEKARAQKLGEIANGLLGDFNRLVGAGVDINLVYDKMGPSISNMVQAAIRSGTEIPRSFENIIREAARLGVLYDEHGKKIEHIDDLGIIFGDTFEDNMAKVKNSMDKVVETLLLIAEKIGAIPKVVDVSVNTHVNPPDLPNVPDLPDLPTLPQADGGIGRVTRPTLFYSGGNEDFAFSGEGRRFGGGGGPQTIIVQSVLDGRVIAQSVNRVNDSDLRLRRKLRAA